MFSVCLSFEFGCLGIWVDDFGVVCGGLLNFWLGWVFLIDLIRLL